MEVARRRQILRRLLDLAEDNVEMDFDRVFMTALNDEDAKSALLPSRASGSTKAATSSARSSTCSERDPSRDRSRRSSDGPRLASSLRAEFQRLNPMDSRRVEEALRAAIDDPA